MNPRRLQSETRASIDGAGIAEPPERRLLPGAGSDEIVEIARGYPWERRRPAGFGHAGRMPALPATALYDRGNLAWSCTTIQSFMKRVWIDNVSTYESSHYRRRATAGQPTPK